MDSIPFLIRNASCQLTTSLALNAEFTSTFHKPNTDPRVAFLKPNTSPIPTLQKQRANFRVTFLKPNTCPRPAFLKPDVGLKSASYEKCNLQAHVFEENLASMAHGPSVPIIRASSEARSLAIMSIVKLAPRIFKGVDSSSRKYYLEGMLSLLASPRVPMQGTLGSFSTKKRKIPNISLSLRTVDECGALSLSLCYNSSKVIYFNRLVFSRAQPSKRFTGL